MQGNREWPEIDPPTIVFVVVDVKNCPRHPDSVYTTLRRGVDLDLLPQTLGRVRLVIKQNSDLIEKRDELLIICCSSDQYERGGFLGVGRSQTDQSLFLSLSLYIYLYILGTRTLR